jgi:hypothetical protein
MASVGVGGCLWWTCPLGTIAQLNLLFLRRRFAGPDGAYVSLQRAPHEPLNIRFGFYTTYDAYRAANQ